jgi:hypothetical protein
LLIILSWSSHVSGAPAAHGSEFRANLFTNGEQSRPAIALDPQGNAVIVWQSVGQDGSGAGIYARRYNALGMPQGSVFRINTTTADDQAVPDIAMSAGGDFVVTWSSSGQDGSGAGIYARRYSAAGMPLSDEFQVNTTTANSQYRSRIAMNDAGDFAIAWEGYGAGGAGIYAQRYSAAGLPLGDEFQVHNATGNDQRQCDIAMDTEGNVVIVWQSDGQDSSNWGVFARRYDATGTPQGAEFQVNSTGYGPQGMAMVAMDAAGNSVIVWQSESGQWDIYAQRYDATGTPQGSELRISTIAGNNQVPHVAMAASGSFLVAWHNDGSDGSGKGIYAQHYAADGTPEGSNFLVNTTTAGDQVGAAVMLGANDQALIAWQSNGQDGSGYGVYAQWYRAAPRPGFTLSPTRGLRTSEAGASAFFTVVLNTQPTANVSLELQSSDSGEGTILPAALIFTPADWDIPQTVKVTGMADSVPDGAVAYTITTADARSDDTNYDGINPDDVQVLNMEHDAMPALTINDVTMLEGDSETLDARFTVQLTGRSNQAVTVAYATAQGNAREGEDYSAASGSLTFAAGETTQTIAVAVQGDTTDEPHETFLVNLSNASGATLLDDQGVGTITDDDSNVSITPATLNVTEGGALASYTISLDVVPAEPVTIDLSANEQISVEPASLVFDADNASTPQAVVVTAVDDSFTEGTHSSVIAHRLSSDDRGYDGIDVRDVLVEIVDDDVLTVAVNPTSLQTAEAGTPVSYTLRLPTQPADSVTIAVQPDAQTSVTPHQVIFTRDTWDTPQTIIATAVDDSQFEGPHSGTIQHSASSTDPRYQGGSAAISDVTVAIDDNDQGTVRVSPATLAVREGGASDTYTLMLPTEPGSYVHLVMIADEQIEISPGRLIFTPQNWQQPQTITVEAVNDALVEGEHISTIYHTVMSDDPDYQGSGVLDKLRVTIGDNDLVSNLAIQLKSRAQVAPGTVLSYTLDYANTSQQVAHSVEISMTVAASTTTTFRVSESTPGWEEATGTYTYTVGDLAAGAEGRIVLAVQVPASAPEASRITAQSAIVGNMSGDSVLAASDATTRVGTFSLHMPMLMTQTPAAAAAPATRGYSAQPHSRRLMSRR